LSRKDERSEPNTVHFKSEQANGAGNH